MTILRPLNQSAIMHVCSLVKKLKIHRYHRLNIHQRLIKEVVFSDCPSAYLNMERWLAPHTLEWLKNSHPAGMLVAAVWWCCGVRSNILSRADHFKLLGFSSGVGLWPLESVRVRKSDVSHFKLLWICRVSFEAITHTLKWRPVGRFMKKQENNNLIKDQGKPLKSAHW